LSQSGFKKGLKNAESPSRHVTSTAALDSNQLDDFPSRKEQRIRPSTANAALGRANLGSPAPSRNSDSDRPGTASGVRNYDMYGYTGLAQSGSRQSLQRPKTAGAALGKTLSSAEIPKCLLGAAGSQPFNQTAPFVPKFVETDKLVARFHAHFMQPRAWDEDSPIGMDTLPL
jgi:hypothetical protein